MRFELTVLGSNSAIPTLERNPSSQVLNINERLFLIDCAEGTQLQLRKFHIKFQKINHIFISHLHGDHYFGLIGLLFSFHLLGREKDLHLYGPEKLLPIIKLQLDASDSKLLFPLKFHSLKEGVQDLIFDDGLISVTSFPLKHSIPTWGFLFKEKKRERNIRKDMLDGLEIPVEEFKKIKNGADFTDKNGKTYLNEDLTTPPPKERSFAYCSDTSYYEEIIDYIQGVDLLYHEATFMEDMAQLAAEKFHVTAKEAASIASKSMAGKLILGHFSARYDDLNPLLREAREVFPESYLGEDGMTFEVPLQYPEN